jgi:hypothetical protein
MGPIPAGSTLSKLDITCQEEYWLISMLLVFETELMGIKGVTKDEL